MGMVAIARGDAGNYRIRGAVWDLGGSSDRAYVHLVPALVGSDLARSVVSVGGATWEEVLCVAEARVTSAVGMPVQSLGVRLVPRSADGPKPLISQVGAQKW